MEKLGKIKRVNDLRSVWPHEEYDFSKWLAKEENISQLSETIGIEIVVEETEAAHDCRMFASRTIKGDLENRQWNEDYQWLVDKSLALKALAEKMQNGIGRA